jgi:hypothetical protein
VAMGHRGREKMMREFDERIVINRYLEIVNELAKGRPPVAATVPAGKTS